MARSEAYLSELLEAVCSSMSDYALHVDPGTRDRRYKRFAPRDSGGSEGFPDIQNFQFDGMDSSSALKFAVSQNEMCAGCHRLIPTKAHQQGSGLILLIVFYLG